MSASAPLLIVGGGLAGSLAAIAMNRRRPDVPVLLIEGGDCFGGNHIWSFFDEDISREGADLIAELTPHRWPCHKVCFPRRKRTIDLAYNSVRSADLDALVRQVLPKGHFRLDCRVRHVACDHVVLESGERVDALAVIDARGPDTPLEGLKLGWQKFVGVEYQVPRHGLEQPIVMDATVRQHDGYRFVYTLPLTDDLILVEDTYYSDNPALEVEAVSACVAAYAKENGWSGKEVRRETGVLPIVMAGDPNRFWPADDPVARLGVAGGFFHPTTGYSLGWAVANALALSQRSDFGARSLATWTRQRFLMSWRSTRYFRLLNRMLFHAAHPAERFRVFEHFYRLSPAVIARFYAGRPTFADKLRILTGRPPVPLARALRVFLKKA